MLITAKIRGGNSGGPVINSNGRFVGIACQAPNYEGDIVDYDDLGYGIAVPVKYLNELIEKKPVFKKFPEGFFRDFVE
jgi:S1-C subfamily serine protease